MRAGLTTRESRPKTAFSHSNRMIVDQATIEAVFDFFRYAMKPMPAKPRIIIAQVEGSGTPDTCVNDVMFELSEQTRQAVDDYLKVANKRPGEFLFTGRRGPESSMTIRQYARLVSEWIGSIGLDPRLFGTHSLRRTKATLIYRRTGNLRAVQLLLGHTKIESTVRYLGIEVDDALAIAEQVDV
jgi:site-specific recombinase XerD